MQILISQGTFERFKMLKLKLKGKIIVERVKHEWKNIKTPSVSPSKDGIHSSSWQRFDDIWKYKISYNLWLVMMHEAREQLTARVFPGPGVLRARPDSIIRGRGWGLVTLTIMTQTRCHIVQTQGTMAPHVSLSDHTNTPIKPFIGIGINASIDKR